MGDGTPPTGGVRVGIEREPPPTEVLASFAAPDRYHTRHERKVPVIQGLTHGGIAWVALESFVESHSGRDWLWSWPDLLDVSGASVPVHRLAQVERRLGPMVWKGWKPLALLSDLFVRADAAEEIARVVNARARLARAAAEEDEG